MNVPMGHCLRLAGRVNFLVPFSLLVLIDKELTFD